MRMFENDDRYAIGRLIREGKTKKIWQSPRPSRVIVENTDRLTAYNGREEIYIRKKGEYAARISCVCFTYLRIHDVPNHFLGLDVAEGRRHRFLADKLHMLPVEFVVRHQPYGSYLARYPRREYTKPFRKPVIECFEKDDDLGDPWLVVNREKEIVRRYMPDRPRSKTSLIDERPFCELGYLMLDRWDEAVAVVKNAAQVLRKAWTQGNTTLVDIKFECGVTSRDEVVIGDTIDADCWRLWRGGDPDDPLDRQLFKNKCDPEEITSAYRFILSETTRWLPLGGGGSTGN